MQLKFRDGSGEHALVVGRHEDHWRVATEAVPDGTRVRETADGAWLVTRPDGTCRRAWVTARGDERLVFCDGVAHRLRRPDPVHADEADHAQAEGPDLLARMPGKVVRLLVAPGQAVAAGQPLVIMESMKMETELAAPQAGTVARVAVGEGRIVAQGDLLVAVTPAPPD
jgi:3-methylcrotonyl-CoA carboxylase alpha subunit